MDERTTRENAVVEAAPVPPSSQEDDVLALRERLASLEAQLLEAERSLGTAVEQANRAALAAEIEAIESRQLLNVSHDALWVVDDDFRILRVNEAMARLVGERPERLKGRRCSEVFSYGLCGTPDCPVTRLTDGGDLLQKDVEGVSVPGMHFIASAAPYYSLDGEVCGAVASFKLFNDTYGHQAGDACLRQVAEALQSRVRRPADLVARYGGEEFVVLLPSTPRGGAIVVAEAVRDAVAALGIPHARSTAGPMVTLSLGCATRCPDADEPPSGLVEEADRALYEAKRAGRNRVEASEPRPEGGPGGGSVAGS